MFEDFDLVGKTGLIQPHPDLQQVQVLQAADKTDVSRDFSLAQP